MVGENAFGLIKSLLLGFGVFILVVAATYLIIPFVAIISVFGIVIGGVAAIKNYVISFRRNVRPEQA